MPPSNSKLPKPSFDGVRPQPEYRYDHELPAPHQQDRLTETATPDAELPSITEPNPKQVKTQRSWRKRLLWGVLVLLGLIGIAAGVGYAWYQQQLSPVATDTSKRVRVTIASGTTPATIAKQLQEAGVIRSEVAFTIYTKLTNTENILQAGTYNLQPSVPTPAIVDHLVKGKQDTFRLTFLPGDTLASNRKKLIEAGYSEGEVAAALAKQYNRPLFTNKPLSADLEGYIFGETYEFTAAASVEAILNRTFDEYEAFIQENDLVNGFKKQGLNLYQGITLASIIQREAYGAEDQKQIARVFLNRMKAGMTLGSDVTYQYIADKTGVARDVNLDSPYNTRRYQGLPPGPIAVPGVGALRGVAAPGSNDYLFFLSGDDNKTYYAKTDAEHQQNIVKYCQKKCLII